MRALEEGRLGPLGGDARTFELLDVAQVHGPNLPHTCVDPPKHPPPIGSRISAPLPPPYQHGAHILPYLVTVLQVWRQVDRGRWCGRWGAACYAPECGTYHPRSYAQIRVCHPQLPSACSLSYLWYQASIQPSPVSRLGWWRGVARGWWRWGQASSCALRACSFSYCWRVLTPLEVGLVLRSQPSFPPPPQHLQHLNLDPHYTHSSGLKTARAHWSAPGSSTATMVG